MMAYENVGTLHETFRFIRRGYKTPQTHSALGYLSPAQYTRLAIAQHLSKPPLN